MITFIRTCDAVVVQQLPNGGTVATAVPDFMVGMLKQAARADNVPIIAVVRAKPEKYI